MFNFQKKCFVGLFAIAISGCSTLNDGLNTLNTGLSAVNQVLGATTSTLGVGPTVRITPAQSNLIQQGLQNSQKLYKGNIANAITEATPNISKVTSFLACYPSYDSHKYLAQYSAPNVNAFFTTSSPMYQMRSYHPQSQCVSVAKFQGWKMPTYNSLRFETIYISEASGQSQKQTYEMVKQPSGEWLFTQASPF